MTFFKRSEFTSKYEIEITQKDLWKIDAVSEMIYSQVGLRYRNPNWTSDTVPTAIKNASMEQLRFAYEYDIPLIDYKGKVKAGDMENELSSDYSTLALRMLANAGYMFRGNPINQNMGLNLPFNTGR
jgi:hypothetical protein